MDASESLKPDADIKNVYGFFFNLVDNKFPPLQERSTVVKYTKLPDFEFGTKGTCTTSHSSYTLRPRLRRIITLGDEDIKYNYSLRPNTAPPPKVMAANYTNRKIITITENDEHDLHPKFTKARINMPMLNKAVETDYISEKQSPNRNTSRLSTSSKYTRETKSSAKISSSNNNIKKGVSLTQQTYKKKSNNVSSENIKTKPTKDKDSLRLTINLNPSKTAVKKKLIAPSESEKEITKIKSILYENIKNNVTNKKSVEHHVQPKPLQRKNKLNIKYTQDKNKTLTIHVPLENALNESQSNKGRVNADSVKPTELQAVDTICSRNKIIQLEDIGVGTNPTTLVDRITEMNDFEISATCKCENSVQTESIKEIFDSLEIPNVTLTKERSEPREEALSLHSTSLTNHQVPPFILPPQKEHDSSSDSSCYKRASYVFSSATLTYTTKQRINFQVVGDSETVTSNKPPKPLDYPINVVSVFKNDLKNRKKQENESTGDTDKKNNKPDEYVNCLNERTSLNCSYVFNKLMKPSDIISTISVNNDLLQNDYICEQFQRELNFIDSFFESLQYLENCSLTDKCFNDSKVESLVNNSVLFDSTFDIKNSEYDNFLSKLENGADIDDTETMASKSLFLLNLLIRDEQRRAKNLLFVLKMREDALKDFTKSQILWLEKKKKHDNTDISTLKKKQRGALLKLQHECGEMQRMRKALLTLSEKRKVALMKTKKNIELKLQNNVDVEQIILGKKKLKRSLSADRITSPLKCFDLSSSGCDESTTSKLNSDSPFVLPELESLASVTSAEKSIQAGDTLWTEVRQQSPDITAENYVAVDGGYLNILFHDLTLPQIFNSGRQYEVNEEMLKSIVNSTNNYNNNLTGSEVVEKLMENIKNRDLDTSSPSTARSLVEEFNQYYRGLAEEDKSLSVSPGSERDSAAANSMLEVKDFSALANLREENLVSNDSKIMMTDVENTNDFNPQYDNDTCVCESVISVTSECSIDKESVLNTSQPQTGPLPVPVGAAAGADSPPPDNMSAWIFNKSTVPSSLPASDNMSSHSINACTTSSDTLSVPGNCEAEELRRQQLAIEREIKVLEVLEQQQSRLLVVREIPDKPPPPYTPPIETKPKPPRMFTIDEPTEIKIKKHLTTPSSIKCKDDSDPFDVFLKDSCHESLERHKQEQSDKPWDACNLLPQKPQVDTQKIVDNTLVEMKEVLTSVGPSSVSGVSSRRSDHIDDILFAEWRRCEPEWTTLHTDEVIVKNQIFESIFQKILTETIDEYKKTVTSTVTD